MKKPLPIPPAAPNPKAAPPTDATRLLGTHPAPPHPLAGLLAATDGTTDKGVAHRGLGEVAGKRPAHVSYLREAVVRHHASAVAVERNRKRREKIEKITGRKQPLVRLFPTSDKTRKGNLAEIVLAEYVLAATGATLPVYRLRYNPNVEQSMKGDDVLAFDLGARPVRIVVGESKFRGESSVAAAKEIVEALLRSHKAGLPASLHFVANQLYEAGEDDVADRVSECAELFATGNLQLDYVGLLLSDPRASERVVTGTPDGLTRLVMISLGIDDPNGFVPLCFDGLE